jgi:hypothetical protein
MNHNFEIRLKSSLEVENSSTNGRPMSTVWLDIDVDSFVTSITRK